jgi:hypothetical protein
MGAVAAGGAAGAGRAAAAGTAAGTTGREEGTGREGTAGAGEPHLTTPLPFFFPSDLSPLFFFTPFSSFLRTVRLYSQGVFCWLPFFFIFLDHPSTYLGSLFISSILSFLSCSEVRYKDTRWW